LIDIKDLWLLAESEDSVHSRTVRFLCLLSKVVPKDEAVNYLEKFLRWRREVAIGWDGPMEVSEEEKKFRSYYKAILLDFYNAQERGIERD